MPLINFVQAIRAMAVPVLLLLSAQAAAAADPTIISSTMPYANHAGTSGIRKQCTWTSGVPAAIVAGSKGTVIASDKDLATVSGRKLLLTITGVQAGGGPFSGPKWAVLHGELIEDGKTLGSFDLKRKTSSGKFGTCRTLDDLGSALASDVLRWLKRPTSGAVQTESL